MRWLEKREYAFTKEAESFTIFWIVALPENPRTMNVQTISKNASLIVKQKQSCFTGTKRLNAVKDVSGLKRNEEEKFDEKDHLSSVDGSYDIHSSLWNCRRISN